MRIEMCVHDLEPLFVFTSNQTDHASVEKYL